MPVPGVDPRGRAMGCRAGGECTLARGEEAALAACVAVAPGRLCGHLAVCLNGGFIPTWSLQKRDGTCLLQSEDT